MPPSEYKGCGGVIQPGGKWLTKYGVNGTEQRLPMASHNRERMLRKTRLLLNYSGYFVLPPPAVRMT